MSSDNYNFVMEQADGTWAAWRNLDASSGGHAPEPDRVFASFDEAFFWADEAYAEYGTSVQRLSHTSDPSPEGESEIPNNTKGDR